MHLLANWLRLLLCLHSMALLCQKRPNRAAALCFTAAAVNAAAAAIT
jgi:hypothetical protein